ncbi:hypothetical protein GCM10027037_25750 [Mucilaginibacter koreensis]
MSNILHILNGDATLHSFEQTGLEGDVMIWREVLSEGPLAEDVSTAEFWKARKAWITQTFDDTDENYEQKVITELAKLNEPYEEINLWFEFDLHCQVNLLAVMQLLKRQVDLSQPRLYLISPDDYPEVTDFRGMGQLNGSQLENLYDGRLSISEVDFYVADIAWKLLVKNNLPELRQWLNTNKYWGNLHWLYAALEAHINRRTTNANGFNSVEQALLNLYQSGITEKHHLQEHFWRQYPIYGMGDKELDLYLANLQQKDLIAL